MTATQQVLDALDKHGIDAEVIPLESLVRERFAAVKARREPISECTGALIDAVEDLIRAIRPGAVIERGEELVPPYRVRPALWVDDRLAVWVSAHRLVDFWKRVDRDALVLRAQRRDYVPLMVSYDSSAPSGNRAAVAAALVTKRCTTSGLTVYSARDDRQMRAFIERVRQALG